MSVTVIILKEKTDTVVVSWIFQARNLKDGTKRPPKELVDDINQKRLIQTNCCRVYQTHYGEYLLAALYKENWGKREEEREEGLVWTWTSEIKPRGSYAPSDLNMTDFRLIGVKSIFSLVANPRITYMGTILSVPHRTPWPVKVAFSVPLVSYLSINHLFTWTVLVPVQSLLV